ncbi:MAG TPA: hypothetical protein VFY99_10935 [Solirubrobacterales bacterium]
MAKKSLRAQLNQIRAWVRQGRTDAWIAHQLEVPASELREFRRRHELTADGDDDAEVDLRDEIEAEIEAASLDEESEEDDETDDETDETDETDESDEAGEADGGEEKGDGDEAPAGAPRRRRRRGRRGRGGRGGGPKKLEATFDHGEEGYGLWLDPAVADDSTYSEHWAGHRAVEVEIEPDRITIRRA